MVLFQLTQRILALMLVIAISTNSLLAAPAIHTQSPAEKAFTLIKDIYSLEYLDGVNGKYRNASLFHKIIRQPGRALATACVYGLTLFSAKKLYDIADGQGIFEKIQLQGHDNQLAQQYNREYRDKQRQRYQRELTQHQDDKVATPNVGVPATQGRNVRIAQPLPGRQIEVQGLPRLPGFYHMESRTPYHDLHDGCGVNVVYNFAHIEARVFGRNMNNQQFHQVAQAAFPGMGLQGASNREVVEIAERLRLAPVIALNFNQRTNEIQRIGREVFLERVNGVRSTQAAFEAAWVAAAHEDINRVAQEFRRTNGARVAHFLCGVPEHWIGISVVRNADGAQAMYLYDNTNNRPHAVNHMRQHIENLHPRFF